MEANAACLSNRVGFTSNPELPGTLKFQLFSCLHPTNTEEMLHTKKPSSCHQNSLNGQFNIATIFLLKNLDMLCLGNTDCAFLSFVKNKRISVFSKPSLWLWMHFQLAAFVIECSLPDLECVWDLQPGQVSRPIQLKIFQM